MFALEDVTVPAQMILSCVRRISDALGYDLGAGLVIQVLRGSRSQRVRELGLDRLSTYGLMKDVPRERVQTILNFLESKGYLRTHPVHRSVRLTGQAREVLFDGVRVELPVRLTAPAPRKEKEKPAFRPAPEATGLFGALKALRTRLAQKERVPAYIIFTNATLEDMAAKCPRTLEEMGEVSGVGQKKLEKYGEVFLPLQITKKPKKRGVSNFLRHLLLNRWTKRIKGLLSRLREQGIEHPLQAVQNGLDTRRSRGPAVLPGQTAHEQDGEGAHQGRGLAGVGLRGQQAAGAQVGERRLQISGHPAQQLLLNPGQGGGGLGQLMVAVEVEGVGLLDLQHVEKVLPQFLQGLGRRKLLAVLPGREEDGLQKGLLFLKVVGQVPHADIQRPGNVPHGDPVVAPLLKQAAGTGNDVLSGVLRHENSPRHDDVDRISWVCYPVNSTAY